MVRAARLGAELRSNAELEAVTKIEEEKFSVTINKTDDLGLPEDDAHSRIEEYLKSQLQSITDESSPEATAKTVEFHHFPDASQNGYGQCSYLRLMDDAESFHCSLVIAKSRVTPLKPVTVPRLELTAALVASKMGGVLMKELEFDQIKETYWTDSKTVL